MGKNEKQSETGDGAPRLPACRSRFGELILPYHLAMSQTAFRRFLCPISGCGQPGEMRKMPTVPALVRNCAPWAAKAAKVRIDNAEVCADRPDRLPPP